MEAWTLSAHGDPRQVLRLREHARPTPKAHEVLIRCEGFGLADSTNKRNRGVIGLVG